MSGEEEVEGEATEETSADDEEEESSIPDEHDIDALRTAQNEARAVLDHQIQNFTDVDDKAAKTFRLDAILLGLLLTALSFVMRADGLSIDPYINLFTITAVIALIVSFISAVITYTTTGIETGVGPEGIDRLVNQRYTEKEWLILLLRSEAGWMRGNEEANRSAVRYLTASHAALIFAVVTAFVGIVWPHVF